MMTTFLHGYAYRAALELHCLLLVSALITSLYRTASGRAGDADGLWCGRSAGLDAKMAAMKHILARPQLA